MAFAAAQAAEVAAQGCWHPWSQEPHRPGGILSKADDHWVARSAHLRHGMMGTHGRIVRGVFERLAFIPDAVGASCCVCGHEESENRVVHRRYFYDHTAGHLSHAFGMAFGHAAMPTADKHDWCRV